MVVQYKSQDYEIFPEKNNIRGNAKSLHIAQINLNEIKILFDLKEINITNI